MKPDPKLDALIAEKVMGWVRGQEYWMWVDGAQCLFSEFSPSTRIQDSWEVVEKVPIVMLNRERLSVEQWRAVAYIPPPSETRSVEAFAPTAAHAICLAALKAVE